MDTTLSAELSAFRDFCTHEGRNIVTTLTHANMHAWDFRPDQIEEFTRQVFQGAMEQLFLQWQNRRSASEPTVVNQFMLPPTPPSTFTQDMNDMGINDTFTINDDESRLQTSQQYNDLDMTWANGQVQQTTETQQQWMYFGETIPMNQGHQFWNDHGVLDGMGGWSG
jgi:phospholipase C